MLVRREDVHVAAVSALRIRRLCRKLQGLEEHEVVKLVVGSWQSGWCSDTYVPWSKQAKTCQNVVCSVWGYASPHHDESVSMD